MFWYPQQGYKFPSIHPTGLRKFHILTLKSIAVQAVSMIASPTPVNRLLTRTGGSNVSPPKNPLLSPPSMKISSLLSFSFSFSFYFLCVVTLPTRQKGVTITVDNLDDRIWMELSLSPRSLYTYGRHTYAVRWITIPTQKCRWSCAWDTKFCVATKDIFV